MKQVKNRRKIHHFEFKIHHFEYKIHHSSFLMENSAYVATSLVVLDSTTQPYMLDLFWVCWIYSGSVGSILDLQRSRPTKTVSIVIFCMISC